MQRCSYRFHNTRGNHPHTRQGRYRAPRAIPAAASRPGRLRRAGTSADRARSTERAPDRHLPPRHLACFCLLGGAGLAACTYGNTAQAPPLPPPVAAPAAPAPAVPPDLTGKAVGEAKAALVRAGFTNVVVAGADGITDANAVTAAGTGRAPGTRSPGPPDRRAASTTAGVPQRFRRHVLRTQQVRIDVSPPHQVRIGRLFVHVRAERRPGARRSRAHQRDHQQGLRLHRLRGNARSHDPWIDDQLQHQQEQSTQPRTSTPDPGDPDSESTRKECTQTSGCDPSNGN